MMDPSATEGVVTLADANYFPGLSVLFQSIRESHPVEVACFDIGLTDEQREWAERTDGITILPIPETEDVLDVRRKEPGRKLLKRGKREWPLWICPYLIAASPFRRTFWIDCDAVVLRDLDQLFGMLDEGPVFTAENLAPEKTPNRPELYDLLPVERDFDPERPVLNAGVSGWDLERDTPTLEAYGHAVREAFRDPRIKRAISWWDQGALIWAVQSTGMEHRVPDSTRWNRCVLHTEAADKRYDWGDRVLPELRRDAPDTAILHWNGYQVPWSR